VTRAEPGRPSSIGWRSRSTAAATWPFLGSIALAEAIERGDRREATWLRLYENHTGDPVGTRLAPFLALAFHEPRLRALRPFTSHWNLGFSTTPVWPFTGDHPWIEPARTPGRYVVRTRDRRAYARPTRPRRSPTCSPSFPDGRAAPPAI
jgi:hypothetical protein